MDFFLYKLCMDDIEIQEKFYMIQEMDYDLIIGIKVTESFTLRIVEYIVRLIINNTVWVVYIKVDEVVFKSDE